MIYRVDCERLLLEALRHLAGLCDGAAEKDGIGFAGGDSQFGKSLAGQSRLSDNQLTSAAKLIQKYRNTQLAAFDLPTVEDVRRVLLTEDSVTTRYAFSAATTGNIVREKPIKRVNVEIVDVVAEPVKVDLLKDKPWLKSPLRDGLNEQQSEAFDLAHEWFFSKPDSPFVLTGRPGTGKSHTAQRIAKSIVQLAWDHQAKRVKVALTAPTHRARAVLYKFASAIELDCTVETMQSLLWLKPGKPDKDGNRKLEENEFKAKKQIPDPHWSKFDLIIADEQSMVGPDLFKFVMKHQVPVILMGDPRQLSPVEGSENLGDDALLSETPKLSPVFDLPCGVNLTKVMRYDGEIAYYVDAIADTIDGVNEFLPNISKFESRSGNLIKIADRQEWESIMLDTFQDGENCRAIAWTNKRVNELNALIRNRITGVSVEQEPFIVGDRVMAKESITRDLFNPEWGSWSQISVMPTCDEGEIISIRKFSRNLFDEQKLLTGNHSDLEVLAVKNQFECLCLTIALDAGGLVEVPVVVGDSKKLITEAARELKSVAKKSSDDQERRAHWRAYFHLLDVFSLTEKSNQFLQRLQFAFASTCHQAQGGTYDYVFSDHVNLMGCRDPFTRNRLIYVASSRAAKQLIAYSKL